jgi:hypothetical protein
MSTGLARLRAGTAAIALLTLSACTAKGTPSPVQPTPTDTSGAINVCGLVTAAEVASITGLTLGAGTETDNTALHHYTCTYGAGHEIQIQVTVPGGAAAYSSVESIQFTAVSGVGDKAGYSASQGLTVLYGDALVQVNATTLDVDTKLAQAVQSAMGG